MEQVIKDLSSDPKLKPFTGSGQINNLSPVESSLNGWYCDSCGDFRDYKDIGTITFAPVLGSIQMKYCKDDWTCFRQAYDTAKTGKF